MKLTDLIANTALLCCLIKTQLPFELSYNPATHKDEQHLQLTLHINPKTTINFDLEIEKP